MSYTVYVSYILNKALYMVPLINTQIDTHFRNLGFSGHFDMWEQKTVTSVIRG